nr:hypothetical protein CFP56_65374 [Quercus suber]
MKSTPQHAPSLPSFIQFINCEIAVGQSLCLDEKIQAALLKTNDEREKVIQKFKQSKEFLDLQFMQYFKGFELLRRWTMKHHSLAVDFSSLDFEKTDTKVLEDEAKELEEVEFGAPKKDKAAGDKVVDESSTFPS